MRMEYPKTERSQFIGPCEQAIIDNRAALLSGRPISIHFSPRGREDSVRVTIDASDPIAFETDWSYEADPSHFPRRIRAAAYALFKQCCFGDFEISHRIFHGAGTIRIVCHRVS